MVVDVWGRELLPHVPLLLSGSDSQLLCFVHPLKEDLGLEASNIQGQSAVYKPQLLRCVRAISCRSFLAPSEDVTWETTRLWSPGASPRPPRSTCLGTHPHLITPGDKAESELHLSSLLCWASARLTHPSARVACTADPRDTFS